MRIANAVIADTTPLYAAFDPSDQYHQRSQRELERLKQEDLVVFVAYPIVLESYSLVLQRFGAELALTFVQNLVEFTSDLLQPTPEDYQGAIQKVNHYPDQQITLFDAITAVIAERLHLPVWTYDYHFDIMRIKVWR